MAWRGPNKARVSPSASIAFSLRGRGALRLDVLSRPVKARLAGHSQLVAVSGLRPVSDGKGLGLRLGPSPLAF